MFPELDWFEGLSTNRENLKDNIVQIAQNPGELQHPINKSDTASIEIGPKMNLAKKGHSIDDQDNIKQTL